MSAQYVYAYWRQWRTETVSKTRNKIIYDAIWTSVQEPNYTYGVFREQQRPGRMKGNTPGMTSKSGGHKMRTKEEDQGRKCALKYKLGADCKRLTWHGGNSDYILTYKKDQSRVLSGRMREGMGWLELEVKPRAWLPRVNHKGKRFPTKTKCLWTSRKAGVLPWESSFWLRCYHPSVVLLGNV